jgi:hypothetical protein
MSTITTSNSQVKGGSSIKKNVIIYGGYLAVLGVITVAVKSFGLDVKIGLWVATIIAAVFMALWPRW